MENSIGTGSAINQSLDQRLLVGNVVDDEGGGGNVGADTTSKQAINQQWRSPMRV